MRTLILSIWISVILLPFSGCTHDDKELLAFYLSQPRDSKLMEKPNKFAPFGQTKSAHLIYPMIAPLKVLVIGVNFILPF